MKLNEFLHFNQKCPICNEPLSLYMQWINYGCFKAKLIDNDLYQFDSFMGAEQKNTIAIEDNHMLLLNGKDGVETSFGHQTLFNESKKFQIYFFYLCNPEGFNKKTFGDWDINLYKGCYYRSTPFMEFKRNSDSESNKWDLGITNISHKEIINKDESFSFKNINKDVEKVYMLNLDYEANQTTLWHYTVSEEEKRLISFEPKVFSKEMPLLKKRPKLSMEDRQNLIDRFDAWIIMS